MGFLELLLIGVGLSADAFAVSVCKGLAIGRIKFKNMVICGLWFGGFQFLMPTIGYFAGSAFAELVDAIAPWIAFILLALIGFNMVREALGEDDEESEDGAQDFKTMLLLAIATSIDALAVGISMAMVPPVLISAPQVVNALLAAVIIGCTTFTISCAGVKIGSVFGTKYQTKAQVAGGVILILIGVKIIAEHFGIFA